VPDGRESATLSTMVDDPLQQSLRFVPGVGPIRAGLLERMGILTVRDLLFTLPRDVLDLTTVSAVHELTDDRVHSVRGRVVDRDARRLANGRSLVGVLIKTDGGYVRASWFNQPYMLQKFRDGEAVLFSGQPKFRDRRWEITHPRVQWLGDEDIDAVPGILPRYRLTEGLSADEMRRMTAAVTTQFAGLVPDPMPHALQQTCQLVNLSQAVLAVHCPLSMTEYLAGRRRILFDDLFEFQLGLALRRRFWQKQATAVALPCSAKIDARIRRRFPYRFTAGQEQAIQEITGDLARSVAMHRLLQADVGSGKTAVALYAMLVAIAAGAQAVLMTPTEILARQHWNTIEQYLSDSRVTRRLLTGDLPARQKTELLAELRDGRAQLIVGTQAIIQDHVEFHRLGLVVIDEQHKFGVEQRSKFSEAEQPPHVLVMTATPIPRSMCLTAFGDLDLTVMTDRPPGRQPVLTHRTFGPAGLPKVWEFVNRKVLEGRQAYVVCPRIESDPHTEPLGGATVEATLSELPRLFDPKVRWAAVHGQQSRDERELTMQAFRAGELDVLVATTVIEVGVDVPNATLMVILDAERFGLSQLHQLRGRIGRGKHQGHCFVSSSSDQPEAVKRLTAFEATENGFELAEADFELRGPGDVLGTRQHGTLPLRVANLSRDGEILEEARRHAFELVNSGEFDRPEYAPLKITVLDRFAELMQLPRTG
jgi:ATP-dependent DNA helicase RecG